MSWLPDLPPGVAALCGAAVGVVGLLLSASYPERLARRRAIKGVIFGLLDARYQLVRFDPQAVEALIKDAVQSSPNASELGPPPDGFPKRVEQSLELSRSLVAPMKESEEEFRRAVRELASLDPTSAYLVSGTERWSVPHQSVSQLLDELIPLWTISGTSDEAAAVAHLKSEMISRARCGAIEGLKWLALRLARKVSWVEWLRVRTVLRDQELDPEDLKGDMRDAMERLSRELGGGSGV